MDKNFLDKDSYLEFRGKPLVREGDTICYGDLQNDKYVLILEIFHYKKDEAGNSVPDKVMLQVVESADQSKIIKQATKDNIYDAFSMGVTMLEVELKQAK